jgi:hypothetical protein
MANAENMAQVVIDYLNKLEKIETPEELYVEFHRDYGLMVSIIDVFIEYKVV